MPRIHKEHYNSVVEAVLGNADAQNLLKDLRDNALSGLANYVPSASDPSGFLLHHHKARLEVYTYLINMGQHYKKLNSERNKKINKGV